MAWRRIGDKSLSKPTLVCRQMDPWEQTFLVKNRTLSSKKVRLKMSPTKMRQFCPGEDGLRQSNIHGNIRYCISTDKAMHSYIPMVDILSGAYTHEWVVDDGGRVRYYWHSWSEDKSTLYPVISFLYSTVFVSSRLSSLVLLLETRLVNIHSVLLSFVEWGQINIISGNLLFILYGVCILDVKLIV